MTRRAQARLMSVEPAWALPGARITVGGEGFGADGPQLPVVRVGGVEARVLLASPSRLGVRIPDGLESGRVQVTVDGAEGQAGFELGGAVATGIHQVDNPAIAPAGTLYLTNSGQRGQQVPVSVFRVGADGVREAYLSGIVNATALAFDARGVLHISSRFDGTVYRVKPDHTLEVVASDLGVVCGLAFGADGSLFAGDRGGTIFRIVRTGHVVPFVTLPPSVVAYHLAAGPDDDLFVTGPTFDTCDRVYRVSRLGEIRVVSAEFGRPQGLACDADGALYVVEAVAGGAGLYRVREGHARELVMAAPALVGIAIDPRGGLVAVSPDTAYRLDVPLHPWRAVTTAGASK